MIHFLECLPREELLRVAQFLGVVAEICQLAGPRPGQPRRPIFRVFCLALSFARATVSRHGG